MYRSHPCKGCLPLWGGPSLEGTKLTPNLQMNPNGCRDSTVESDHGIMAFRLEKSCNIGNLKHLSLPDLKKLATGIDVEIRKCARQTRKDVWRRFEALAREHGMLLAEVVGVSLMVSPPQVKEAGTSAWRGAPAKYVHPSDRRLTWAGRGRQPQWVDARLAAGGTMSTLAVAAEKLAPRAGKRTRAVDAPAHVDA